MKKVSAIVLAVLMLIMAAVPFAASAEDAPVVTLSAADVKLAPGADGTLKVSFDTGDGFYLINGSVYVIYNADELEVKVPVNGKGKTDYTMLLGDEVSKMVADGNTLTAADDETLEEGQEAVKVAFAASAGINDTTGTLLNVPVKLKDGVKEATVKVVAGADLSVEDADEVTVNAVAEEIEVKVAEEAPVATTTTGAPTTTTTAPAPADTTTAAPADNTTAAPEAGENTPWALLTVTALAGAALVGLTMKRK